MQNRTEALIESMGRELWLTDGGFETCMLFLEGFDLPQFASFPLLDSDAGKRRSGAIIHLF